MTTLKEDVTSNSPLQIRELNHVALHVRDLDAAVHFYGEVLGLALLPRPGFDFPGAWFALGTQELHLIVDPTLGKEQQTFHFALLVTDAVAAHAELKRRGVIGIQGPGLRPDGAVQVFFNDPDGNRIEITSLPSAT